MNIGLIADSNKRLLMQNLCIAYKFILHKHDLYATHGTGQSIEQVVNLRIKKTKPGKMGGSSEFAVMIEQNMLDALIFLRDPDLAESQEQDLHDILRKCDQYNVPYATNMGMAEMLIRSIDRGDLEWRELLKRG